MPHCPLRRAARTKRKIASGYGTAKPPFQPLGRSSDLLLSVINEAPAQMTFVFAFDHFNQREKIPEQTAANNVWKHYIERAGDA
jgi:hypothetical protein